MTAAGTAIRKPLRAGAASESTLATAVVDRLRAEILSGKLAPGEKLRLEHVAARYGVGRTPLREACCRLTSEGLVTILDQRGFRVTPISRGDLLDLTRTRQQIETLALRASIAHGDLTWERDVSAALERLRRLSSVGPRRTSPTFDLKWETEHAKLHAALLAACESPLLLKFHALLFEQSERYRRLSISYAKDRDIGGEHEALVRAALDRDAERACALLVEHIARTAESVLTGHPALAADAPASPSKMSTK